MTRSFSRDVALLASVFFTFLAAAAQPSELRREHSEEIHLVDVQRSADPAQAVDIEMASAPRSQLYEVLKELPAEYRRAIYQIEMIREERRVDGVAKVVDEVILGLVGGRRVTLRVDDENAPREIVAAGVRSVLADALAAAPRGQPYVRGPGSVESAPPIAHEVEVAVQREPLRRSRPTNQVIAADSEAAGMRSSVLGF